MQVIPLNKGMYAVCDDSIWQYLMRWNWTAKKQTNYYYATRHRHSDEDGKELIYMHHVVCDYFGVMIRPGYVIDHINRNALDNRRANLRPASYAENALNAQKRNSKSGYLGVRWDSTKARWRAYLTVEGKEKFVCYADSAKTAAIYRDRAALSLYENATLNFPEIAAANDVQSNRLPEYEPTQFELDFLATHRRIKLQPKRRANLGL